MLYTQEQLISYAAYHLKKHGVKDEHGRDKVPSHADRMNWEEENNIQPLQIGQELTIETIDGLKITAAIQTINHTQTV